jgi:AcrR family transcriptional regulator
MCPPCPDSVYTVRDNVRTVKMKIGGNAVKMTKVARANRLPLAGGRVCKQDKVANGRCGLSREQILKAALAIADRDALDGLTIRKLALHLGVSPMGIYRYFRNKAELIAGLVDLAAAEYNVAGHSEADWAAWLRETFCLMRKALLAHPGVLPLLGTAASSGPNAMATMEEVLRVLRRAGLDRRSAASVFHTLISYTIGAVAIESHLNGQPFGQEIDAGERLRQSRLLFEAAPRPTYPSIVDLAEQLALLATDEEFVRGLDRILDGLKVRGRTRRG